MRVSVPGIPKAILNAKPLCSTIRSADETIERLSRFLKGGNVAVLTGAGVSVDSGIRAYRGKDGRYANPNYIPIFYHELMDATTKGFLYRDTGTITQASAKFIHSSLHTRLRSYLGYPPVRDTQPNTTHFALAALQYTSHISRLVTQNVDGLHQKAIEQSLPSGLLYSRIQESILELHGSLHRVHCSRGHITDRNTFQDWLSVANPHWHRYLQDIECAGVPLRTNPDGDVAIEHLGLSYTDFVAPECPACAMDGHRNSQHKPTIVFFGESIPKQIVKQSYGFEDIEQCDKLLLMGTTLATYSAFRLVKRALALSKPVALLNLGPTRADGLAGIEKFDVATGDVMRSVAKIVAGPHIGKDTIFNAMLRSGITRPPSAGDNDRHPRAAG